MAKFTVGQRVRCLSDDHGRVQPGEEGVVKNLGINDRFPLIEFDRNVDGHDYGGCKAGHGWFLRDDELEAV